MTSYEDAVRLALTLADLYYQIKFSNRMLARMGVSGGQNTHHVPSLTAISISNRS